MDIVSECSGVSKNLKFVWTLIHIIGLWPPRIKQDITQTVARIRSPYMTPYRDYLWELSELSCGVKYTCVNDLCSKCEKTFNSLDGFTIPTVLQHKAQGERKLSGK